MRDRLHGLRLPDCTNCGRTGRLLTLGDSKALVQGDRLYRIAADHRDVDCVRCLGRIARHGLSFAWADIAPHEASTASQKRRRRRRRNHADTTADPSTIRA